MAIVRPGPIQGDMVHPYLRRRDGVEAEHYPSPSPEHGPKDELQNILGKTKGVPLFQEQAMRIAHRRRQVLRRRGRTSCARRWPPSAAAAPSGSSRRRWSRAWRRAATTQDFAQRCFNQIKGFGEYGFPESHAASFAHLVYVSSWIKCHHPAAFAAALLNSQPMGFYAPAQIVRDAREHGVEARAADVNLSDWDCTLEAGGADGRPALRLGLRQIDGLQEDEVEEARRGARAGSGAPFRDVHDSVGAGAASPDQPGEARGGRRLPLVGLDRRQALWDVKALGAAEPLPLFAWTRDARSRRPSRRAAARDARCRSTSSTTTRRCAYRSKRTR